MSGGDSVTSLAYKCVPQWMMAGYEVIIPFVQPVQVFHLRGSGQLTPVTGLTSQHKVPYAVKILYLSSIFQYMRQEVVYICQVIAPWFDADVDETVETLALLVAVEGVSA